MSSSNLDTSASSPKAEGSSGGTFESRKIDRSSIWTGDSSERKTSMVTKNRLTISLALLAAAMSFFPPQANAQQKATVPQANSAVKIDADDIGGVVRSTKGPEAGVWVIAETKDL